MGVSPRQRRWPSLIAVTLTLCTLFTPGAAVKEENFKTCSQAGFCARNRAYADTAAGHGSSWEAPYALDSASVTFADGTLRGVVVKSVSGGSPVRLPLTVAFLESGAARVTLDEERRQTGDIELRHGSAARKERYNEVQRLAIVGGLEPAKGAAFVPEPEPGTLKVVYGPAGSHAAVIRLAPFGVEFLRDGEVNVRFNERGLLNVEHWRAKVEKEKEPEKEKAKEERKVEGDGEDSDDDEEEVEVEQPKTDGGPDERTWWDESFGGSTDSKPKGPESVALDITFPGYEHVFGIPSHTGPMSLKETRGGSDDKYDEPYRMYNADVFEYILDSPMTLYGSIPFMQAHRKGSTVGVFWLNAAETWVDIVKAKESSNPLSLGIGAKTNVQTHWVSESGLIDVFVMLGPTPNDIIKTYAELTGYTELPPLFSIAYHQCRWNYVTDDDVRDVDRKFDKNNIPYDVIWLDIEYTNGKKYFTWDPLTFKDPIGMQKQLDEHQRKLVVIIDPHIKKEGGYHVVDELTSKGLAVKNKDGNDYDGWCWPGSSHWIDAFNPAAISWWKSLFKYDKFTGTAANTFLWNDMNEPSVFNGPETTMPKDNLHYDNWEHRDVHNLNGMTFHNATYQALLYRDVAHPNPKKSLAEQGAKRPFILTRSFYAGSQRYGAMWTGDNQADWGHLAASIPMVMSQGISGFPFAGADVGGFFGNPSKELLTRWYQAGAFYPFFRGHAHIDTRRREPYIPGSPYTEIITQALRLRYALLPAWYTAFHAASKSGTPIVQPNWWAFPDDEKGFAVEDQMYLSGTGLLVKPVTTEGGTSVSIHLPDNLPYYDYADYTTYRGPGAVTVAAPLEKLPLLMRAGHIFPRRDRPRRSSGLMRHDPLTLVIVLDGAAADPQAVGELYLDDGASFEYTEGAAVHRRFRFAGDALTSEDVATTGKRTAAFAKTLASVLVERVVIVGAPTSWAQRRSVSVSRSGGGNAVQAEMEYVPTAGGKAAWAVVKRPGLAVTEGWKIDFAS